MTAFPKPTRKAKAPTRIRRGKSLAKVRAERKAAGPGVSPEEWEAILRWYEGLCAFCGLRGAPDNRLVQDHVLALARGGQHCPENVVPCHERENIQKGTLRRQPLRMHPYRAGQ